ncbi:putative bifunctional diguanylate cyclase/phosphodiesterase [Muricoccus aerilatus]|uniref:putative bifunctional diguanylate cyclase/phosphodiesterase n=1 Tax=Muricoccus aerilatus TaxID=452982 RepID=UPI000A06052E|nr:sensor domain-containing phosphodiesterase [Roseomonas aerilata]
MPEPTEEARLDALYQLDLLDTDPSEAFDRITRMAAQIFGLPIAAVSLTDRDRQWFKSRVGVSHTSIPRNKAPCAQVAETSALVVIPDLLEDPCYRDSHLAQTGVRFYAGAPLVTNDGFGLGAMCVLGLEPRQASSSELAALADLGAMVMAQIELQHAFGRVDPLSRLSNRTQFAEDLEDLARDQPEHDQRLAVLIDLASPEQLSNSTRVMGSSYLDDMVRDMSREIRTGISTSSKLYHVGATQFLFLTPKQVEVRGYAARLAEQLSEMQQSSLSRFVITTVAGVAPFRLGEVKPLDVLRNVHGAAQDARRTEVRVGVYSPTQDTAHQRRFTLLNDFGAALEAADQLRLVFQPRIDVISRTCVGAEALLRWRHPGLGEISPAEFMPIIEQTSMVRAATAWVLETALDQLLEWRGAGLQLQVSVNISAANLLEPDFADRVLNSLAKRSLAPSWLELEITETGVMEDTGQALAVLEVLTDVGVRLAIDDFGTGYSSLSYLQRIPAHVVKIDQTFVRDLATDERQRSLTAAMVSLSHNLGYRVVAEGVEAIEALNWIESAGCDEAQGYFFARPLAVADFSTWCLSSPYAPVITGTETARPSVPHSIATDLSAEGLAAV